MVMGGTSIISPAVVQAAGHAWRLHRRILMEAFHAAGLMKRLPAALDRAGLETRACEGYGVVRAASNRMRSDVNHLPKEVAAGF